MHILAPKKNDFAILYMRILGYDSLCSFMQIIEVRRTSLHGEESQQ